MDYTTVFADIEPIPMDDGPNPMSPIAYPAEYSAAMDVFRACAKVDERSKRVLDLTAVIIDMNPAHYTVWKVRQDCLFATEADLKAELQYASNVGFEHHKNYQVWHHREIVVTRIGHDEDVIRGELRYINEQLDADCKNYHAWSYRQWLVKHFQFWEQELADVDKLITSDFRNNSAWNHRFFVLSTRPEGVSETTMDKELEYCQKYIQIAPNNESPWNYMKGILKKFNTSKERQSRVENDVKKLVEGKNEFVVHAAGFLLNLLESKISDTLLSSDERSSAISEASQVCKDLMQNDMIRMKFWSYRLSLIPSV
ncbi:hypothetical protein CcCBS67573_g01121 [Chytriomyces confervae]|uniref:Protein farnesyltransferase/geranylgeranyltransferase type-1 subunit alpha n=1 Tax=Chytriomyces confervae TaxID=246404 RepID=A0A507FQL6_9FUNG|nr:CAAX geranylgeranyltransferase alpha subunit [Chytriomyces hyalinus]TPX77616.1 hypothetical protein CcCBS67573_g01121 [Chytriomyces confervae]